MAVPFGTVWLIPARCEVGDNTLISTFEGWEREPAVFIVLLVRLLSPQPSWAWLCIIEGCFVNSALLLTLLHVSWYLVQTIQRRIQLGFRHMRRCSMKLEGK